MLEKFQGITIRLRSRHHAHKLRTETHHLPVPSGDSIDTVFAKIEAKTNGQQFFKSRTEIIGNAITFTNDIERRQFITNSDKMYAGNLNTYSLLYTKKDVIVRERELRMVLIQHLHRIEHLLRDELISTYEHPTILNIIDWCDASNILNMSYIQARVAFQYDFNTFVTENPGQIEVISRDLLHMSSFHAV